MIRSHTDLVVWQRAVELAVETYRVTAELPRDERFGIIAQMRRAAISVVANIAEGCGRATRKEIAYFLVVSRGSLRELESYFAVVVAMQFLDDAQLARAHSLSAEIGKMLNALRKRLRTKH